MPHIPRICFAASNSRAGFVSYYDEIFSERRVEKLYIIKGGPGTGKSRFMKAVAHRARERGYTVTEYLCSSDPASLDGILLTRDGLPSLGLLDGTPPHAREPYLPGAREELVNLGEFWDPAILTAGRDTIASLGREKATAYAHAYACLRAAGEMDTLTESMTEPWVDTARLHALAARLLKGQPSAGFDPLPALRRAISMGGKHTLRGYEAAATSLLLPAEGYGMGYRLTRALLTLSEIHGHRVCVSYDPLNPARADGLLYPDTGLCVLVGDALPPEGIPTRHLSLRRYTDKEAMRRLRGELRQAEKLKETLTQSALRHLKTASDAHFRLERIYADAMNFSAKEAFTERFCGVVLGER
jgi:hypothetical protein